MSCRTMGYLPEHRLTFPICRSRLLKEDPAVLTWDYEPTTSATEVVMKVEAGSQVLKRDSD